jgi:outer membrane protein OmpA-like peptidoglycan-associated protein
MRLIGISLMLACGLLSGCASSNFSRNAAGNVQALYESTDAAGHDIAQDNISGSWNDSTQTTRGAAVGAVAGTAVGATTGIGWAPGLIGGTVLGAAVGSAFSQQTTLIDKLKNRGSTVMVLGDHIRIVLPSERLFADGSAVVQPSAYETLNLVAQLIGRHPNRAVHIAAFADDTDVGSEPRNVTRTQHQADSVMQYLWHVGVDSRLVYAAGYGTTHPVVRMGVADTAGINNRVEISFVKLPEQSLY